MARSNPELISALKTTADRLDAGARYEWGHMGRCNCGHLVQTITEMTDREIAQSVNNQLDEWSEYANDYCDGTGAHVEDLFTLLGEVGFGHRDVIDLENLSDNRVLNRIDPNHRHLRRNQKSDVSLYMRTMAEMLQEECVGC